MNRRQLKEDKQNYLKGGRCFLAFLPFFLLSVCFVFLVFEGTRNAMLWILDENHPIELITFGFFIGGAVLGFKLVGEEVRRKAPRFVPVFHFCFSLLLLLIAMEEISWGQQFFGFETPEQMQTLNRQGELNLHNVSGLQGHSEWFRLLFGVGGLVGVACLRWTSFDRVSVPLFLLPWFVVIAAHASYDVFDDFIKTPMRVSFAVQRTSECVEMLISIAATLYLLSKHKTMRSEKVKVE